MLYKLGFYLGQLAYANKGEPYDKGDVEVYAYGFEMFWENVLSLGLMLAIGIFIGCGYETVFFLLAFLSMRSSAGGYHAKTSGRCFLSSLVIYSIFLFLLFLIPGWLVGLLSISCVCFSIVPILKLAPFRDEIHTPLGQRLSKIMRKRTIVIFTIQVVAIVGLSGFITASQQLEFPITDIIPRLCLSISLGLLTSVLSLIVAKIEAKNRS